MTRTIPYTALGLFDAAFPAGVPYLAHLNSFPTSLRAPKFETREYYEMKQLPIL